MDRNVFRKTSTEVETFGIDYRDRLSNEIVQNDTISTSDWSAEDGITIVTDAIDSSNRRTTVKVSGGTSGERYTLTNTVVTAAGRTLVEAIDIIVRD